MLHILSSVIDALSLWGKKKSSLEESNLILF